MASNDTGIQQTETTSTSKLEGIKTAIKDLGELDGVIPKVMKKGIENAAAFEEKLIVTNRTLGLSVNYTKSIQKEIAQAAINTVYLGGNLGDAIVVLEKMNSALERTTYFSSDFLSNVQAVKQFGIGEETISTFVKFFDKVGGGMDQAMGQTIELVRTAQDYGLNAGKFVQDVASQMDKLNKYGFPKGVDDLASMVAKSKILGDTLSVAQGFADSIMDSPEKAYEYAAQLQTLGGSFSQLGDGAQLLYMAQNDLKGLQDQIINATRGIATFNKETGQFQISANERLRLKQLKNLNLDVEKIEETALKLAKQEKIIQELNFSPTGFKNLKDEDKELIANYAQITKGGVVEIKGQKVTQETNFTKLLETLRPKEDERLQNSVTKNVDAIQNNLSANEQLQLATNKLNNAYTISILKQDDLSKSFDSLKTIAGSVTEQFTKLVGAVSNRTTGLLGSAEGKMDTYTTAITEGFSVAVDRILAGKTGDASNIVKGSLDVNVTGIDLKLADVIKTTIVTEVSNQLNARGYSSGTATR